MDLDTPQTRPRPQDPSSGTKLAGAQFWDWFPISATACGNTVSE